MLVLEVAVVPAPVETAVALMGLQELWPLLFVGCCLLVFLPFWAWMIVECITKEPKEGNDRLLWLLVLLLANWIGALIYFLARRPARIRELGR